MQLTEEGLTHASEALEVDIVVETLTLESLTWDEQVQLADLLRKLTPLLGGSPVMK